MYFNALRIVAVVGLCIGVTLGASAPAWSAPAGGASATPLELLRAKEKELRKILSKATEKGTPAHKAKEDKIHVMIDDLFDFAELGKRTMGRHWKDRTEPEKEDFLATLRALIEKTYLMRIADKRSYVAQFFGETEDPEGRAVRVRLTSGTHKSKLQFRLLQRDKRWFVFDMLIDDVSIVSNYRSQFNRIIKRDGFPVLMEKMKKKLAEDIKDDDIKVKTNDIDD
jgi:phospholipid transport system substrate-binding protein